MIGPEPPGWIPTSQRRSRLPTRRSAPRREHRAHPYDLPASPRSPPTHLADRDRNRDPKVAGSNPAPATNENRRPEAEDRAPLPRCLTRCSASDPAPRCHKTICAPARHQIVLRGRTVTRAGAMQRAVSRCRDNAGRDDSSRSLLAHTRWKPSAITNTCRSTSRTSSTGESILPLATLARSASTWKFLRPRGSRPDARRMSFALYERTVEVSRSAATTDSATAGSCCKLR